MSQSYPIANDIQNIDPTVLVDDDARVFLYWGTFGRLKGVELERDMVTFKATPMDVRTLNGFFEAPWLFKRNGTYYMAYAANTAGPNLRVHGGGLLRLHRVRNVAVTAWSVDVSRRDSRSGVVDDVASGDRGVQGQVVPRLSHGRREERWTLSPLGRDRSARMGRWRHSGAHQEGRADRRRAGRLHADREHRVACAHHGVERCPFRCSTGCAR